MFCKKYDVAICGGGVAGCAASLACARRGVKTVLIENAAIPGGLATSGLVLVFQCLCDGRGNQVVFGLCDEFFRLSNQYGPGDVPPNWKEGGRNRLITYFSPASLVMTLDELLENPNLDIWYDTRVIASETDESGRLTAVQVANKSGLGKIMAECFIDATGDADLIHFANGACHTAGNAMVAWVIEHREAQQSSPFVFGRDISTMIVADDVHKETVGPGIDGRIVSDYLRQSRKRYRTMIQQDYAAGTENRKTRFPIVFPTMVTMRHSRCIKGKLVLEDEMHWTHFEDSVGLATHWGKCGDVWEIPYRSLLPETLTGVLAAGRCSSARGEAWEVSRVIPNAILTGEAAGVAAAMSLAQGILPHELEVSALQKELKEKSGIPIHFEDLNLARN